MIPLGFLERFVFSSAMAGGVAAAAFP